MEKMKMFLKDNVANIILCAVMSYIFFKLYDVGYIKSFAELSTSEHFNILSIASLFGGFVFTGLGIIISGLSSERVKRLNKYGYMEKYYYVINLTLICNIATIISAIVLISSTRVLYKIAILEQWMLYLSIVLFIKCMFDLRKIIDKIRNE